MLSLEESSSGFGGMPTLEGRRRGGEGVDGASESEISSMAELETGFRLCFLGRRWVAKGVSLSDRKSVPSVPEAFLWTIATLTGEGLVELFLLGRPTGRLGDSREATVFLGRPTGRLGDSKALSPFRGRPLLGDATDVESLSALFTGDFEGDVDMALLTPSVPRAILCFPSQHFSSNETMVSLFLIGLKRYEATSFDSWAVE